MQRNFNTNQMKKGTSVSLLGMDAGQHNGTWLLNQLNFLSLLTT